MTPEKKAARHRQWAANAIAEAMRVESEVDQETLMMIARQHLARAQSQKSVPNRRKKERARDPSAR
jgi:hypothetical protein